MRPLSVEWEQDFEFTDLLPELPATEMEALGWRVKELIVERTMNKHLDANDQPFRPYTRRYLRRRLKRGRSAEVSLYWTGRMLGSIAPVRASTNVVEVGFTDAQRGLIAFYHVTGAGHLPVRDFFGLSPSDLRELEREIERMIADALE